MLLVLGRTTIDLDAARLDGPHGPSRLTELECRLLAYLAGARGATVSRGELLERVWGFRATMHTRTVDVAMARLRARVEEDPGEPRHLLTVRGEGYRLDRDPPREPVLATAPPPPVGVVRGREVIVDDVLQRLPMRAVQLTGLPGMGRSTVAAAVAARWAGPVAWVAPGREEDVIGALAAAFGIAADPLHVLRVARGFEGLLVVDGAGELPFPPGPRVLIVHDRPVAGAELVPVGGVELDAAVAILRDHTPRPIRAEEVDAVTALAAAADGVPLVLAQLGRRLRVEDALALLARVRREGVAPPASWAESCARLSGVALAALTALATFPSDFPYDAAEALADAEAIDELLASGWLTTRWSARGELRLALAGPHRAADPDPRLGAWLATLPPAALLREAPNALAWAASAPAAPASLLARLHEVCRIRGGWSSYTQALARVPAPELDADLAYARAEARWQTGDVTGSLADFARAIEGRDTGERRALRAFYRSRVGDRQGAMDDLATVGPDEGADSVEALLMGALLDSEAGEAHAAEARLRAALAAAERIGRPRQVARARFYLGTALLHLGERAAGPQLERAVNELRALEAEASAALAETVLAWARAEAGDLEGATVLLDDAIRNLGEGGLVAPTASARRARAAFRLAAGEPTRDELRALIGRAAPGEEPAVRAMLACVEAREGDPYEARRHAASANDALRDGVAGGESAAIVQAWLHAVGLGPAPEARWAVVSPEVRLVTRLAR